MSKEYYISKLSFRDDEQLIKDVSVYESSGDILLPEEDHGRSWMVNRTNEGTTISIMRPDPKQEKTWILGNPIKYENGLFSWEYHLPENIERRKTFVSYYHNDDQYYRKRFENLFRDLVISKSVEDGDIDSDNSDEYIKQLIQKDYMSDTTILVVLVGPNTKCRKHVDWEISGALDYKVGDHYSGLLGILLPNRPDYGEGKKYHSENLPKRLAANLESGYSVLYDWTDDRVELQKRIEITFKSRSKSSLIANKEIPQMKKNTCD